MISDLDPLDSPIYSSVTYSDPLLETISSFDNSSSTIEIDPQSDNIYAGTFTITLEIDD